jgi:Skp family chaperone for outer membrane proteins
MMNRFLTSLTSLLIIAAGSIAAAEDVVICTADLQIALASVDEGQQALARLTAQLDELQEELNEEQEELAEWLAELEASFTVLSEDVQQERMQEYERRVADLRRSFSEHQSSLAQAEAEATQRIAEQLLVLVNALAEERGCTWVLQTSAVLFGPNDADFTEDLVNRYNAAH